VGPAPPPPRRPDHPEVIEAVLRGLAAAPLRAVAIVCALRHDAVEDNVALAREAGRFAGRGVVGFDLAGDEARWPTAPHAPRVRGRARRRAATSRATRARPASRRSGGGAGPLGVERIGHGVIGARDPRVVERVRREGVVLEEPLPDRQL